MGHTRTALQPSEYTKLDVSEARDITRLIKARTEEIWDLLVRAYYGRAWDVLGYKTWDAYCATEFKGARLRIPSEQRAEVVASLTDQGLSVRAIAASLGVDKNTVLRDKADTPKAPKPTTGLDGKTYTPRPPRPRAEPKVVVTHGPTSPPPSTTPGTQHAPVTQQPVPDIPHQPGMRLVAELRAFLAGPDPQDVQERVMIVGLCREVIDRLDDPGQLNAEQRKLAVERAINDAIGRGVQPSSRGIARALGKNDDKVIRKDWDELAAAGKVPARQKAAS